MHFLIFLYYIHYQFLHIFFLDLRDFDIIDFRYYNKKPTTTNEKKINKKPKKLYKKHNGKYFYSSYNPAEGFLKLVYVNN